MHEVRFNRDSLLKAWLVAVAVTIATAVTVAGGVLSEQQSAQAQEASTSGSYDVTFLGLLDLWRKQCQSGRRVLVCG
jgi:hypothetical protein